MCVCVCVYVCVFVGPKCRWGKRELVRCYNCGQQGHIASRCPSKVVLYAALEQTKRNADNPREEPIMKQGINGTTLYRIGH